MLKNFVIASLFLLGLDALFAQNGSTPMEWPIFRGDANLSGYRAGSLPDDFSLAWSFQTADEIKSAPIVASDLVFFGSSDGKIYALTLETGRLVWQYDTGSTVIAPPLYVAGTVIAGATNGILYALQADTGEPIWNYATGDQIQGSANWFRLETSNTIAVVVGSYDGTLYCIGLTDGKKIWEYQSDNFINGTPALWQGKVIFGGCDALIHVLDAQSGRDLATIDAGAYIAASPAIADNEAYVGHYGSALVKASLDNNNIQWEYGDEVDGMPFFSSPALSASRVVVGSRDNYLHCISRRSGKKIWAFYTGGEVDSSPIIVGNRVIFGSSDGIVYMLKLTDGTEVWSYEIGAGISGSPAVVANYILIGSDDGRLYAFKGVSK